MWERLGCPSVCSCNRMQQLSERLLSAVCYSRAPVTSRSAFTHCKTLQQQLRGRLDGQRQENRRLVQFVSAGTKRHEKQTNGEQQQALQQKTRLTQTKDVLQKT